MALRLLPVDSSLRVTEAQGQRKAVECKPQNTESSQMAAGDGDPQQKSSTCSTALDKENTKLANPRATLDPPHAVQVLAAEKKSSRQC